MPKLRPVSSALIYVVLGDDVFDAAEVLRGAAHVAREAGATVVAVRDLPSRNDALRRHPRSGVIVMPYAGEQLSTIEGWDGAAVGLYSYSWREGIARVTPDDHAVGVVAAEHLLSRGYRRLAYYGVDRPWSDLRRDGFCAAAAAGGVQAETFRSPDWNGLTSPDLMKRFLAYLSGPAVGVLACNDACAGLLRDVVTEAGRAVPDDVGIMGVDNRELRCVYDWIPLTSVDVNARQIGMQSARLLLELLDGTAGTHEHRTVRPAGVVARLSTDALAIADPDVAVAVRLIRQSATTGLGVEQITRRVGVSRATLDRRFKEALGHTVSDELLRVRLAEARRQLESTRERLSRVAESVGFKHLSNFSTAFRRAYGKSPSRWRAEASQYAPDATRKG